MSESVLLEE